MARLIERRGKMDYPWYKCIADDSIEQGDIFQSCPVFIPPSNLTLDSLDTIEFQWEYRDVVVLSQTCDLVKGREKLTEVLLCAVWSQSDLKEANLASKDHMEKARKGNLPAFHLLAACSLEGASREIQLVDFRRVYSLPLPFLRGFSNRCRNRIRLLPPYREHLSQAFARFFMRVGLPVDIPPFK